MNFMIIKKNQNLFHNNLRDFLETYRNYTQKNKIIFER